MIMSFQNPETMPDMPAAIAAWAPDGDLASAARADACVLLSGRKDAARSMAYRIHSLSGWRFGAFTVVDCTRPESEIESLLFGPPVDDAGSLAAPHARLAQDGTVLLQEVGRLSRPFQNRIAEWLMGTREIGARRHPRRRLMAGSSEPLLLRVLAGTFDDQLFYRLNVIHLVVQ